MILFFYFGLSVCVFLFLLTLVKRNKNHADFILATWMGFMTIHLILFVLDYTGVSYQYPHLLGIILPLPILHGFFLYAYTFQTVTNRFPRLSVTFLHLTPFLLLVLLAVPFYVLPPQDKLQVYQNHGKGFEWYSAIQITLFVIVGLAFSAASVQKIRNHRKQMMNVFSNHEQKQLVWLERISFGLGFIWLLAAFFNDQVIFSGVVLFILFIGVFGIQQTPVFFSTDTHGEGISETEKASPDEHVTGKYQKSGLSDDDAKRLSDSLETFMALKKPYKNPDLTLDELSVLMNANPNQLSQVINSRAGKTFYHFINSYRIREFLTLATLPESNKYTFLGLASDCGFQSKTTFNKYFKIQTGKTPSEYFQATKAA